MALKLLFNTEMQNYHHKIHVWHKGKSVECVDLFVKKSTVEGELLLLEIWH
jgi:hypothetical protein